jgi:hypothetical protein
MRCGQFHLAWVSTGLASARLAENLKKLNKIKYL